MLSGPGIVNLYQAMSSVWGIESEPKTAEEIVHEGLSAEPLCHQTLETFAGLLGGAAGNLALTVGARGGVYISGGIAPQACGHAANKPSAQAFRRTRRLVGLCQGDSLVRGHGRASGAVGSPTDAHRPLV